MSDKEEPNQEESIEERYEDNEYVHVDESDVEVDKQYTSLPIVDIRMRSDTDTLVEIYHRDKVSIRTDKQNGYVQDIYYYDHDEIPFQAVVDDLKTTSMDVEKNTTKYSLE